VGASFGATVVAGGLPWWVPIVMSLIVFAGGSQIAATSVVIAGGSPAAAVAAGALLNTRMGPYGFAVSGITGRTWWTRLLGAHITTDESVAFALRYGMQAGGVTDPRRASRAFWMCGASLFAVWNVSVGLGVLAGTTIGDTSAFGLDATFPAVMLALALPALSRPRTRAAASGGAVVAVALTPLLPAGLPVLAGLSGLLLCLPAGHGRVRRADAGGGGRGALRGAARGGGGGESKRDV